MSRLFCSVRSKLCEPLSRLAEANEMVFRVSGSSYFSPTSITPKGDNPIVDNFAGGGPVVYTAPCQDRVAGLLFFPRRNPPLKSLSSGAILADTQERGLATEDLCVMQKIRTPNLGYCKNEWCGKSLAGKRSIALYCSEKCYRARTRSAATERTCKQCGTVFPLVTRADANRQYCTQACAKRAASKIADKWLGEREPGWRHEYYITQTAKNPGRWVEKHRSERTQKLELLGGMCAVPDCGVTNPLWLHIDFIPTTRNSPYRHPRGIAYIRRNLNLFRLLCANHHYELTLTGKIEGSDVTQTMLAAGQRGYVAA